MTFYQNFADGAHIKDDKVDIERLLEIQNRFERIRNERALSYIKAKKKLLEIGSGRGSFAKLCKKKKIEYFGVEPQVYLCKKLKKEGFKVINKKVPPIPFKGKYFDYVVHFHVIEHLKGGEEVYNFFSEIRRVLNKGGRMIFRCPNAKTWGFSFWDVDYTHSFITSPKRLEQVLYDAGFDVIIFDEFSFLKPFRFGGLSSYLAKIKFIDSIYPVFTYTLGKIFKKNTELFYVCEKK